MTDLHSVTQRTRTGLVEITRRVPDIPVSERHRNLIDTWLGDLAAELGLPADEVASTAAGELLLREHYRGIYDAEAARRGVLAL